MTAVRPAVPADIPAIAAILAANDEPVDWPDVAGWPYVEHLLGPGAVAVAEVGRRCRRVRRRDRRGRRALPDRPVRRPGPARARHRARAPRCGHGRGRGAHDEQLRRPAGPRALHPLGDAAVVAAPLSRRRGGLAGPAARRASTGRPPRSRRRPAGRERGPAPIGRPTSGTTRACRTPPASSSPTAVPSQRSAGRGALGGKPGGRSTTSRSPPMPTPSGPRSGRGTRRHPGGERVMGCVPGPHPVVPVLLDARDPDRRPRPMVRQRPGSDRSRSAVAEPELPLAFPGFPRGVS